MAENGDTRGVSRRQFLIGLGALGGLAAVGGGAGYGIWRALSDGNGGGGVAGTAMDPLPPPTLDEFAENVIAGGPGRGGIPAIDEPKLVQASGAGFLRDRDLVFGLVRDGEARAYPQLVLVWHEIVNDEIGGKRLAITYCPLTGSVVGFEGQAPDGRPLTFNTTGNLVNSNLLMFDNETDSEWPQILGRAISGSQRGERLEETPLVWSPWERWRADHPDTLVLSTETGFGRPYGSDPYGSYTPLGGYYEPDSRPIFPVLREPSEELPPKAVVLGVKAGDVRLAVAKQAVEQARVLPLEAGGRLLVAAWDEELATARVFEAQADGRELRFRRGDLRDATTGSTWSPTGEAIEGTLTGARLPSAVFYDVMWFAWFAFYPQTEVVT